MIYWVLKAVTATSVGVNGDDSATSIAAAVTETGYQCVGIVASLMTNLYPAGIGTSVACCGWVRRKNNASEHRYSQ